jgi:hypothetical protein
LGLLALFPGPSWPAAQAASAASAPKAAALTHDRAGTGPGAAVERVFPGDAFRNFLLEIRRSEDSLHYRQGEQAFGHEDFDMALSHHLAAELPAAGEFRADLLAQRSRIFARIWPSAGLREEADSPKAFFDWEIGTEHSRGNYRTGPRSPFGEDGFQAESSIWSYYANARQDWSLSLPKQDLDLALNASAKPSAGMGPSDYTASIDISLTNGILENISLSASTGLSRSQAFGSYRYNGLQAAKAWYFKGTGTDLEAGYSGQWSYGGARISDNAWTRISRDFQSAPGKGINVSLACAFNRVKPQALRDDYPVLYVDDIALAQPSHFQGPATQDPVALNDLVASLRSDPHSRGIYLNHTAPQSNFSLAPAFDYGFSPLAGWLPRVGAKYALDIYPEYAWDRLSWPDGLDPGSWDMVGLALNRADGRYYADVMFEEDGAFREYFGTIPLERRKTRRIDHRAGLDLSLARQLPSGYSLSFESSAELEWSNLPASAPVDFRPWRFGLAIRMSHSSFR